MKDLYLCQKILLEGADATIVWNAEGCHKIKVSNLITLPGNIKGIKCSASDLINPMEICFYGTKKQIKQYVSANHTTLNLLDSFEYNLEMEIPIESKFNHNNPIIQFKHLHLGKELNSPNLNTNFAEVSLEFDSFTQETYQN